MPTPIYLKNAPKNATIGHIFIQHYVFKCTNVKDKSKDDFHFYEEDIVSVDHLHTILLRGKNILIYKFRFKRNYPEIIRLYLLKYHTTTILK
jgi:hypothetical protein